MGSLSHLDHDFFFPANYGVCNLFSYSKYCTEITVVGREMKSLPGLR